MKLRVAVLQGGRSGEHEVSLQSAKSIMADRRDALSYGALDELRNSAILLIAATSKI